MIKSTLHTNMHFAFACAVPTAHARPYLKNDKRLMEDKWKNTPRYFKV